MISIDGAFDWRATLDFLSRRAIAGLEHVNGGTYTRTVALGATRSVISIVYDAPRHALAVDVEGSPAISADIVERVRRMFGLDADLAAINAGLSRDPFMAPLVAARPAVRVAGGWDPFEVAIRTVVGQQVSVERARQVNGVLVARCGSRLGGRARRGYEPLQFGFPRPEQILAADLSSLGMPGARVETLRTVAAAAIRHPDLFIRGGTLEDTIDRLRGIRGVGEWTAHYIAMRACREPDAFPASDVGLLRAAADASGRRPTPAALLERARPWRPWRAYAAHHLWALDSTARNGVPAAALDARLHS